MSDVNCPYCDRPQEINHDDGYGYDEDALHDQQCSECDNSFTFTTSILYLYEARKADCLNGANHIWEPITTYPIQYTRMQCKDCHERRSPTEQEWELIYKVK